MSHWSLSNMTQYNTIEYINVCPKADK